MAKTNNLHDFLVDVADTIRDKKGYPSTQKINPQDFSDEIDGISGGGGNAITYTLSHVTTTNAPTSLANNTYAEIIFTADNGYNMPNEVTITGASYEWYPLYGRLILKNPTGDITVTVTGTTTALWYCTVSGLGSSSPSSVTFSHNRTMPTLEETTLGGNTFIKIPTMYRKVVNVDSNQIKSFTISNYKIDNTYEPYSVFVKEDGVTVMPYVLMGKYFNSSTSSIDSKVEGSSSQTIGNGRSHAKALGTGYLLYDWQFQKLWQDLLICKMNTINTNSGSGFTYDQLGFYWSTYGFWVDGVAQNSGVWCGSLQPSKYVDSPTTSTSGYFGVGYSCPTSASGSPEVSKLGYDASKPFFNMPNSTVSNSSYNTYYCDYFYYSSGNHPVASYVGVAGAGDGAFRCRVGGSWSSASGVRLCYRPL